MRKKWSKKLLIYIIIAIFICTNLIILFQNSSFAAYNQVTINANSNNNNGIDAFPESYRILLNKLVDKTGHTNWRFKPFYTNVEWSELIEKEGAHGKNAIHKSNPSQWFCSCMQVVDTGYYCPSKEILSYYLDPRNFLTETSIFQFLELSCDESTNTIENIDIMVKGGFLEGYAQNGEKYSAIIKDAATDSKESPFSIVSRIYQEVGRGTKNTDGTYTLPRAVSGTDATYPNTYNFFNYGASDGEGAVDRGLAKANELGWHDPRTALVDGAKKIAGNYIQRGQNTKYLFKFNVVDNGSIFSHQYMTNIQDPNSQASTLFSKYNNYGWKDNELTFVIPVYKNMPQYIKLPSNLSDADGDLHYISSNYDPVGFRTGPGTGYSKITSLQKDTLVAVLGWQNGWANVKISGGQTGWVTGEYLTQVNRIVDNYVIPSQPSEGGNIPVTGNSGFKIDGSYIITEPGTTVKNIKDKGKNVISAVKDGVSIGDNDLLATGAIIVTDEGSYTVIKLGDANGDGIINSGDLLRVQKHLLKVINLENTPNGIAADATQDNVINSGDLLRIQKHLLRVLNLTLQ